MRKDTKFFLEFKPGIMILSETLFLSSRKWYGHIISQAFDIRYVYREQRHSSIYMRFNLKNYWWLYFYISFVAYFRTNACDTKTQDKQKAIYCKMYNIKSRFKTTAWQRDIYLVQITVLHNIHIRSYAFHHCIYLCVYYSNAHLYNCSLLIGGTISFAYYIHQWMKESGRKFSSSLL